MGLESNIKKYNLFAILRSAVFSAPIVILFMLGYGFNYKQVMFFEMVFGLTLLVMEIPTGYFADRFGRRTSIIIGGIVLVMGSTTFYFSKSFWWFFMGNALWAIGASFCSGADTAFIYDTLAELKRKDEYKKIEGHAMFLAKISEAGSAFFGGLLSIIDMKLTFLATAAAFLLLVIVGISMKEPKRHAIIGEKGHLLKMYKIARFALHRNKVVKWIIIYSTVVTTPLWLSYMFSQPYLKGTGIHIGYFGIIFAAYSIIAGLSSKYAYLYEKRIGLKAAVISLPIIGMIAFFTIGKFVYAFSFLFFFLLQVVRGFEYPIMRDMINRIVWPENRATILSISSFLDSSMYTIVAPLLGWFIDVYSLPQVFYILGASVGVLGCASLIMLHRNKAI